MAIDRAYLNLCTHSLQSADQAINRSVKLFAPHRGLVVPNAAQTGEIFKALDQLITAVSYLNTAVGHLVGGAEQELRKR